MDKLEQVLNELEAPMLDTLRQWLRIPSLLGEAAPKAPYGAALRQMLDKALADCEALGLSPVDFDGHIMHADIGEGPDEDALAVLAHLDVVPAGDGWTREPFGAQVEDGRLYGRGSSDNKGPAVAALYAMAAVRKAGIPLKRKVRLILGCDEESGMGDIEHYHKVATMPRSGFSPDANYPVINIEKGLLAVELTAELAAEGLQLHSFSVGERRNVVPGAAEAEVYGDEALARRAEEIARGYGWPLTASHQEGRVLLRAVGINGHAAFPHLARNAIGQLLLVLRDLGAQGAIRQLADGIGTGYDGEGLGVKMDDGLSGPLTLNLGIIRKQGSQLSAVLDLRLPLLCDAEQVERLIRLSLPGFRVERISWHGPHHVPANSELVQALLNAYHEVTGLPKETIAIGGGTYARALQEGVAFGALFPGEPDVAHQADEHIAIDSLNKNLRIFARAIVKLAGA